MAAADSVQQRRQYRRQNQQSSSGMAGMDFLKPGRSSALQEVVSIKFKCSLKLFAVCSACCCKINYRFTTHNEVTGIILQEE